MKKAISVIIATVMVFGLAACGQVPEQPAPEVKPAAVETTLSEAVPEKPVEAPVEIPEPVEEPEPEEPEEEIPELYPVPEKYGCYVLNGNYLLYNITPEGFK